MEFLKSLWPNSSTNVITIPQHIEGELEDDLDLKIKSLTYLFKRLNIENLPAFINDENGIYDLRNDEANNEDTYYNTKLDTIYNKIEFERVLINDEHRILVDWFKNRFRSICILSNYPSKSNLNSLGKHFKFIVLKPDSSDEDYLKILINSDIYYEHPIDPILKTDILLEILKNQKLLKPSYKKNFNKNDRSIIILKYVRKLSEIIQIERIYKASLLTKLEEFKNSTLGLIKEDDQYDDNEDHSDLEQGVKVFPNTIRSNNSTTNLRSRSRSPIRKSRDDNQQQQSQPTLHKPLSTLKLNQQLPPPNSSTKLTPPSSPTKLNSLNSSQNSPKFRSRSSSPIKSLKKKQSMTLLKMDKSLNNNDEQQQQQYQPTSTLLSNEEKSLIYSQSEQAVLFRVERERKLLRSN
ncbi:hypothetical protein BN7_4210 [Wickerhamomyces ciferrii]|uniref:Uncharacterized protein n=1 Tax=Wickerhamomyces ciferrii (strain ATCC 14091 / BCRC 22168 / CBS 111 / JCM 3599 / NBRC 0793 / NRRL Y-1031 F-60-10) TaxID=1206466 RepID=K0KNS9_WICCF|nr:uncharacterized protein BN7_4210 [Wickerhamomyces ciferrii]CCH44641.1 hypothetical protein BN7_4210 [Wickerhamomyces ciferrii]